MMKLNGISVMPLKNDSPSPPPPPMAQMAQVATQVDQSSQSATKSDQSLKIEWFQIPIYAKVNNSRQTSSPRVDLLPSPNLQGNENPGLKLKPQVEYLQL